jgi:MFS family permease
MEPKKEMPLKSIVRALRHRNFRLFFGGQSISLIGTWMQRVALSWLVYRLTNSPFLLGLVGFSGQIPVFLLAPFAGVLADRWDRRRILILTQTLAMVQAFVLSFLVLTGMIRIWHIISLSVFLGMINSFDMPTRQSFVVEMIGGKKDLGNAIALNSSMVNGARLLGPTIAGILIAAVGEGTCFLINALSYLAVIASLLAMKIERKEIRAKGANVWHGLGEGFRYALGFEPIWAILLMLALISLVGMPYVVLMPIFAKDILRGGPDAFGFLMGSTGVGALVGAVVLASRKSVLGLGRMIPTAASIFGCGLIAFSFSNVLVLSMLLMLAAGFGQMVQMASSNTLLQTIVEDDKRGRVMSFYAMAFMGLTPVGSLFAGFLASKIGAPWTVCGGGIACTLGAAFFAKRLPALRAKARPIYVQMGIIPEIATGIRSAAEPSVVDKETE